MPIITKPTTIQKAQPATITLNKQQLALVPSVASDSYFSNQTNWKEVVVYYKSTQGNQKEVLKFDATLESPQTTFLVSNKSRNNFNVQKIDILDFDEGSIVVNRSELITSEFDIILTSSSTTENIEEIYFDESLRPLSRLSPPNQNKFTFGGFLGNYARSTQPVQQNEYLDLTFYITGMSNQSCIVGIDNGQTYTHSLVPLVPKYSWLIEIRPGEYSNFSPPPSILVINPMENIVFSWNASQSSLFTSALQPNNSDPLKIRILRENGTNRFKFYINTILIYTSPILNSAFTSNIYPVCVSAGGNPATFSATKKITQSS
jgi:hypothetical protein